MDVTYPPEGYEFLELDYGMETYQISRRIFSSRILGPIGVLLEV